MKQARATIGNILNNIIMPVYHLLSDTAESLAVYLAHFYYLTMHYGTFAAVASIPLALIAAIWLIAILNPFIILGIIAYMALTQGFTYLSRLLARDTITSRPIVFNIKKEDFFARYDQSPIGSSIESHCVFKDENGNISWYVNGVKRDAGGVFEKKPSKISDFTKHLESIGYKDISGSAQISTSSGRAMLIGLKVLTVLAAFALFPVATWSPLLLALQITMSQSFLTELITHWAEFFSPKKTFTDCDKNNNWHGHFFVNGKGITHTPKGVYIDGVFYDKEKTEASEIGDVKLSFRKDFLANHCEITADGYIVDRIDMQLFKYQFPDLYKEMEESQKTNRGFSTWEKDVQYNLYSRILNNSGCSEHVFTNLLSSLQLIRRLQESKDIDELIDVLQANTMNALSSETSLYGQRKKLTELIWGILRTAIILHPATAAVFATGLPSILPALCTLQVIGHISGLTNACFKRMRRYNAAKSPGSDNYDIYTHIGSIKRTRNDQEPVFTSDNPEIQSEDNENIHIKSGKTYIKRNSGLRYFLTPFSNFFLLVLHNLRIRWNFNTLTPPGEEYQFFNAISYKFLIHVLDGVKDLVAFFYPLYTNIFNIIILPEMDGATAKSIFDELPDLSIQWVKLITNALLTFLVIFQFPALLSASHLYNMANTFYLFARIAFGLGAVSKATYNVYTWYIANSSLIWPSTKAFVSNIGLTIKTFVSNTIAAIKRVLDYLRALRSPSSKRNKTSENKGKKTPHPASEFSTARNDSSRKGPIFQTIHKWMPWIKGDRIKTLADLRPLVYQLADEGVISTRRRYQTFSVMNQLKRALHSDKAPRSIRPLLEKVFKYIDSLATIEESYSKNSIFDWSSTGIVLSYKEICKLAEELRYAETNNLADSELLPYLYNGISAEDAQPYIDHKISSEIAIKGIKSGKNFGDILEDQREAQVGQGSINELD